MIKEILDRDGGYEIAPDVYLWRQDVIAAEQKNWSPADESKNIDLSTAPYWVEIVHHSLEGYQSIEEVLQWYEETK